MKISKISFLLVIIINQRSINGSFFGSKEYPDVKVIETDQEINYKRGLEKSFINPNESIVETTKESFSSGDLEYVEYNEYSNTCEYNANISITQINIDLPKKKNEKIFISLKMEIKENFKNQSIIIKEKEHFKIIQLETKEYALDKKNNIDHGDCEIGIRQNNLYWTEPKDIKFEIFNLRNLLNNIQERLKKNKTLSNYNTGLLSLGRYGEPKSLENLIGSNSNVNSFSYNLKNVPCDSQLPVMEYKNSEIIMNQNVINSTTCFCIKTTTVGNVLNLTFDLKLDFLKKEHLKIKTNKFMEYFKSRSGSFSKFKSFGFKANLIK